ncbi:MAG: bifunctional riboflavin kinase/FAD synthetase [Deltaproteobacteria bacterium]|nr:bifunctional riboflavin kinase/FAD synthetase [Deltaproteobacteria bacterium]
MNLYSDYRNIPRDEVTHGSVVTIGNFDGVHRGHQTVIQHCQRQSEQNGRQFIICTFEPHPAELFAPDNAPPRLTTPQRKQQLLSRTSPDILLCQTFDRSFASMTPDAFVSEALISAMNAKMIVVGKNFRFGKKRAGDIGFLQEQGRRFGFDVIAENLLSTSEDIISSTRVRTLIAEGNVTQAAVLLHRYHELPGVVVQGQQVGRSIGFPTVNIDPQNVISPNDGIYSAFVSIEDNSRYPAAVYIGNRPTLQHGRSIEAHLLDFDRDMYGKPVTVHFVSKIREDMKFESLEQLTAQIQTDVRQIRTELEKIA